MKSCISFPKMFLICLMWACIGMAMAQMPSLKIVNSGMMMSTYGLADNEKAKNQIRAQVGEFLLQEIVQYSEESSWPEGISTLDARNKNRPLINEYAAYKAATFGESNEYVVLCIPPAKNTFQPANMQAKQNFFFIISKNGVVEGNNEPFVPTVTKSSNDFQPSVSMADAKDFPSQLNVLLEALHNNFADLKGKEVEEKYALGEKNECLVQLEGANETYIYRGLGAAPSIIADFGDYKDRAEAQKQYELLAKAVSATSFPCCTLVENNAENELLSNTYWLPFNLNGKMHPSMENMVMEVQMMKTLGIDSNTFKTYDNYSITLRIYRQN